MRPKQKPLTEKGSLFNSSYRSLRGSTEAFMASLDSMFLQKELQEYVGRFAWKGLPKNVDAKFLETMLYYKGQVGLFKVAEKYYILPYVYTGPVNQYGLQTEAIPISFSGSVSDERGVKFTQHAYKTVLYEDDYEDVEHPMVICQAQTSLVNATAIPPIVLSDQLRAKLTEHLIIVRNNLILSQPIKYISVENEAKASSLRLQTENMLHDILNGDMIQTIVGTMVLGDINSEKTNLQQQSIWQSYASLDNLRMELFGILNNGVFQKKERKLTDEVAGTQSSSKLALQDALDIRKRFCKLANQIFGLNISVELSEFNQIVTDQEPRDNREGSRGGGTDESDV